MKADPHCLAPALTVVALNLIMAAATARLSLCVALLCELLHMHVIKHLLLLLLHGCGELLMKLLLLLL